MPAIMILIMFCVNAYELMFLKTLCRLIYEKTCCVRVYENVCVHSFVYIYLLLKSILNVVNYLEGKMDTINE